MIRFVNFAAVSLLTFNFFFFFFLKHEKTRLLQISIGLSFFRSSFIVVIVKAKAVNKVKGRGRK